MAGKPNAPESGPSPGEQARRVLFSHRAALLVLDEIREPLHYAIDGRNGGLVTSAPRHAAESDQWLLLVPEESDDALQLLLEHAEADESVHGAAMDRHQAMHGKARWPCWRFATISSARIAESVIDPEDLPLTNPLLTAEASLVRALNADRPALARACRGVCGRDIAEPLAVGVDSLGIDVRTTFGVVRLPFSSEVGDADAARRAIAGLTNPAARP